MGPKGRTLLTGGTEGVSYLWSLRPEQDVQKSPAALFEDLMGKDAPVAYQAFWAMVEQPDASLKVIEQQLVNADVSATAEELKMLSPTGCSSCIARAGINRRSCDRVAPDDRNKIPGNMDRDSGQETRQVIQVQRINSLLRRQFF